jgi:Tfp pilus assembly protein PilF
MALNVTISTQELHALLETGYLLWKRGEVEKAEMVFEGVLALRPDVEAVHAGLANAYWGQGKNDQATSALQAALEQFPQSAHLHAQIGELFHTLGQTDNAKASLQKAIEFDPQGPFGRSAQSILALVEEGVAYTYGKP